MTTTLTRVIDHDLLSAADLYHGGIGVLLCCVFRDGKEKFTSSYMLIPP